MELEHAIGFTGSVAQSLHYHPSGKDAIYVGGGCVVVSDLSDPHNQHFLRGHDGPITSLDMSKDGKMLASGQVGENSDVIVWDAENKSLLYRLSTHEHGIAKVAFSHDSRFLLTVGDAIDKSLYVWAFVDGKIAASAKGTPLPESGVTAAVWGGFERDIKKRPTNRYILATAGQKQVVIWIYDPTTGKLTPERCQTGAQVRNYTCLAFSDDGEVLFAGSESGDLSAFSVRNRSLLSCLPVCSAGLLTVNLVDHFLITGGGDGSITVMTGVTAANDSYAAAGARGPSMQVVSRGRGQGGIKSVSIINGRDALIGTDKSYLYRCQIIGGGAELSLKLVSESHAAGVIAVGFPPDVSDHVVSSAEDGSVRVWDLGDYSVKARCEGKAQAKALGGGAHNVHHATSLAVAVGCVMTGWTDGDVRCFDEETGEHLWTINNAHRGGVSCLCVAPNQAFIVSGGEEGDVRVWDVRSREMLCHLKEHTARVTSTAVMKDCQTAISASRDRSALCWDLQHERRVSAHTQRMGGINSLALHQNMVNTVTVGQEKKVTYWDLREEQPVRVIDKAHAGSYGEAMEGLATAISHDGKLVATGGTDQRVLLWDFATGKLVVTGIGHSGDVTGLSFSPDDKQLVSVGKDGMVFVWNIYR